jgi:hypothetical protein
MNVDVLVEVDTAPQLQPRKPLRAETAATMCSAPYQAHLVSEHLI